MERDRIWTAKRTEHKEPAKIEAAVEQAPTDDALVAKTARLEAERDNALEEAERLRRSIEVMRKTLDGARAEADAEIGRLRQALTITREAMESERDVTQRDRKALVDNLNSQQALLKEEREKNSKRGLLGSLLGSSKRTASA